MNFNIKTNRIKARELIAAQSNMEDAIALMSRFVVDGQGNEIPEADAKEQLLDLDIDNLIEVETVFMNAFSPTKRSGTQS